jgi:hypothetical protein
LIDCFYELYIEQAEAGKRGVMNLIGGAEDWTAIQLAKSLQLMKRLLRTMK